MPATTCAMRQFALAARVLPRLSYLLRGLSSGTSNANYFKLLGVHERFNVDATDLSARFKALQREWHPDKHASNGTATTQAEAADMSALINEAYGALRVPHSRARHLLSVLGADPNGVDTDPAFLAWVVECRERIADAEPGTASAKDLSEEIEKAFHDCLSALDKAFEEKRLEDAAAETNKLRYLWRMRVAMEELS